MSEGAAEAPRLTLFGPATVVYVAAAGGVTQQPFASERLFQLAAFLAVRRAWVSRDQLTALFWPDLPPDAARRNLRKLLYRAQRQPWFAAEVHADALRWEAPSDLRRFDDAVAAADWHAAVDAYGGVLLQGLEHAAGKAFGEWLGFERTRVAAAFRAAAARRCAELAGASAARLDVATRWLQHDPFDEDALAVLVDTLRATGRAAEAERVHRQFVERLATSLAVEPSARVLALGNAAPATAQPRATADVPAPMLVGRRAELQTLASLLERPGCRLLTVLGPGGAGKSRLARAALAGLAARYPDGAIWVALEDNTDLAQAVWRIAGALGVDLAGAADPASALVESLRPRRALIALDNAEHLPGLPALVARVLADCPSVQLLATSRVRLAVDGEWLLPLEGLPCPDDDETETDALRAFDAVRLFELRAAAAAPSFDPQRHAPAVARLVRLVAGLPLAIELAAAWVRLLPVDAIAAELAQSLDLLERAAPGQPERLRSVRASFAHSWRLLAPAEQRALARLSVFAGSFTRAAAAQVADAALPVLAGLVDRSLLRADGAGCFSFHALVRENAREQGAAELPAQRQRHARFSAQVLARLAAAGIGRKEAMDEMEFWLADFTAAWAFAVATADHAALDAMAEPLLRFFEIKGRWSDGLALLAAADDALTVAHGADAVPASIGAWRAALLFRKGDTRGTIEAGTAALARARKARAPRVMRLCLQAMGLALWQQGAVAAARRSFERALAIAAGLGDAAARAPHLHGIAMCARLQGDLDGALAAYGQSLALYRATGSPQGEAMTLDNLALLARVQGDLATARRHGQASLRLAQEHGLGVVRMYALVNLALIEIDARDYAAARDYLAQARRAVEGSGGGNAAVDVELATARLALRAGPAEAALAPLRAGLAIARDRLDEPNQLSAILVWAEWLARCGDRARAAACFVFAGAHAAELGDRTDAAKGLAELALTAEERAAADHAALALTVPALVDQVLGDAA